MRTISKTRNGDQSNRDAFTLKQLEQGVMWDRTAKRELKEMGLSRKGDTPYIGSWELGVAALFTVASPFLAKQLYDRWEPAHFVGFVQAFTTGVFGIGALTLGFLQWRQVRNEISLDNFYDRIEETNQLLDKWHEPREFVGLPHGTKPDDEAKYKRTMYVYRELDSLDHTIAKYKIGFMSDKIALSGLRRFREKCRLSGEFRTLALDCSKNASYSPATQTVVEAVVRTTSSP